MIATNTKQREVTNQEVAAALRETSDLLEAQGANPYRVRAYRTAAATIDDLRGPLHQILRAEGIGGLIALPGIGKSIAHAIEHLVRSHRFPLLDRLRGENAAERLFATVPDIGPGLARRIHEELGIESLAELQAAASDGRLATVAGMGKKRIRAVRESLAGRFAPKSPARRPSSPQVQNDAPIAALLSIDEQYRRMARQHELPRIAPRRFNPTGEAWLPILHTERDGRHYTALFSNTARAHELGATRDWVVIYCDDDDQHGQWTVITAHYGPLRGQRIVRGSERACQKMLFPMED